MKKVSSFCSCIILHNCAMKKTIQDGRLCNIAVASVTANGMDDGVPEKSTAPPVCCLQPMDGSAAEKYSSLMTVP